MKIRHPAPALSPLDSIGRAIESCEDCPRLRRYCESIGKVKRRAYQEEIYWQKPIQGFGDPKAQIVIIGLAPGAHGANRTGRIFTGDRSGEWLFRALHRAGLANQAEATHRNDGLKLNNAFMSCVVKCAPPDNRPTPQEIAHCSTRYLAQEIELLKDARVYIALGQIALQGAWPLLTKKFGLSARKPKFQHGGLRQLTPSAHLLLSYHPSQQNTFTGRLTEPMLDQIFTSACYLAQIGSS